MGLPASEVDICNMALDFIGQPPIASISPPSTTTEILVARHYDDARQAVLRKYVWNFAKKRSTCSRTGAAAFDFPDKYQLPNDFVRLLSVQGDREIEQSTDFDIEGRELLIDASGAASIKIRYIRDVTDVTLWDAGFRRLVALTLALDLAYQITKKKAVVEQIDALLRLELPDAVSVDGQEVPPRKIQRSKYITARRITGGSVASKYTVFDT